MYRHLMVPLDDSPLSVDTVQQAVKLAKTLGARITFFHAQSDYGASSIGALERVLAPATFNEHLAGEARAIERAPASFTQILRVRFAPFRETRLSFSGAARWRRTGVARWKRALISTGHTRSTAKGT